MAPVAFPIAVHTDYYPAVTPQDEVIVLFDSHVPVDGVVYIGAATNTVVEVRAGTDVTAARAAAPSQTIAIPAGGYTRFDIPATGSPLDAAVSIRPTKGEAALTITAPGSWNAHQRRNIVP